MNRATWFSTIRAGALLGALPLVTAVTSFACLQGTRFQPEKPPHLLFGLDDTIAQSLRQVELPKFEPLKIDALLAAALPGRPLESPAPGGTTIAVKGADAEEEVFARYIREFEATPPDKVSFDDQTDYAVALVHVGRDADAIKVLLALEKSRPGVYTTAVNLGTAYELAGDLEAAAKWIATGIKRNPASHEGTEWLHLAILQTKLALRTDAKWLEKHTVLDAAAAHRPEEIMRALEYQLTERLHFVKPQDAVVCDLFYQAAVRAPATATARREFLGRESLRFGDWRRAEVASLAKL